MRKYRCPWCGEECLTLGDRIGGTRAKICPNCYKQYRCHYGRKMPLLLIIPAILIFVVNYSLVVIFALLARFKIDFNLFGGLFITLSFIYLTCLIFYAYFHLQPARTVNNQFIRFIYQGYMKITLTDKWAKRYFAEGATLAVRYEHKKAESEQDMIFPIRLSKKIQKYKPGLWEWGYLKPDIVPDELFQEGREVVIIDNGRQVAKGLVTSVFEDFEKDEPSEDAE